MRTDAATVLACLVVAPMAAVAQSSPYAIGVTTSVAHDTNVFRNADSPVSDTTYSAGVTGSLDQPIGRQRIYANGRLSLDRHARLDRLNDYSYALAAGVDWQTVERLAGTLRYSTNRSLADYGVANIAQTTEKNIQRAEQLQASGRWNLLSTLALEASFEHRAVDYSSQAYERLEYAQKVFGGNLRYVVGPMLSVALGARATRGTTPNFEVRVGVFEEDDTRRRDIDLSATLATAKTALTARLSHSDEEHSQPAYPDFSGLTWAVDLDHEPTPKMLVSAGFSRDSGSATTFLRFSPTTAAVPIDTNRLSTQWRLSLRYTPTPKLALTTQARQNRGEESNLGRSSRDTLRSFSVGAELEPFRSVRFGCSLARELRTSSADGFDAAATVGACSASVTLR